MTVDVTMWERGDIAEVRAHLDRFGIPYSIGEKIETTRGEGTRRFPIVGVQSMGSDDEVVQGSYGSCVNYVFDQDCKFSHLEVEEA